MLVTDEAARGKHCCGPDGCGEPRQDIVETYGDLKMVAPRGPRFCVGSDCMAWEWGETEYEEAPCGTQEDSKPEGEGWALGMHPEAEGFGRMSWRRPLPPKGYCPFARRRG